MYRQEPLRLSHGFKLAHLPLSLPRRLMRDLCSVVRVTSGDVLHRGHHTPVRGPVASELVGDQPSRFAPLPLQQLAKEPLGRPRIAMSLNEDVDYISVLVHSTPEIVPSTLDVHEELVEVPRIAQTTLAPPQLGRVTGAELRTPVPDRLVRNDHTALCQKIFDIAEAEAEPVIQPHGVTDDLGREAVPTVTLRVGSSSPNFARPLVNLTVPSTALM